MNLPYKSKIESFLKKFRKPEQKYEAYYINHKFNVVVIFECAILGKWTLKDVDTDQLIFMDMPAGFSLGKNGFTFKLTEEQRRSFEVLK
jgi:hypothetical protein